MTLSPLHYWQRLESVRAAIGVGDHDDAAQILRTLKRELGGAAGPADAGRLVFIVSTRLFLIISSISIIIAK